MKKIKNKNCNEREINSLNKKENSSKQVTYETYLIFSN